MTAGKFIKLGSDRALFWGHLPATQWHRHAAPVLLIGLSGRFLVRLRDGTVETCRSVLIDADVEHIFDPQGEWLAAVYLEPDAPEARALRATFLRHSPVAFDIAHSAGQRGRYERHLSDFNLAALLKHSFQDVSVAEPDARIVRSLPLLRNGQGELLRRSDLATHAQLSASRFNHLFSAEMGVSFRRYRSWSLIRSTLLHIPQSRSLTDAALHTGFSDSAHFSNMFRQMFGLTPSAVLKDLANFELA